MTIRLWRLEKGCIEGCTIRGDLEALGLWNGTTRMAGLSNVEALTLLILLIVLSFCNFKLARIITHILYFRWTLSRHMSHFPSLLFLFVLFELLSKTSIRSVCKDDALEAACFVLR